MIIVLSLCNVLRACCLVDLVRNEPRPAVSDCLHWSIRTRTHTLSTLWAVPQSDKLIAWDIVP